MRIRTAFLFLFLSILPCFAQHHIFRKASVELPSPECYRIIQDKQGYVWVATEQGLCRFDGQNTTLYAAKKGIPEKGVYALKEDENGVIWALTKTGRVLQLRNGEVRVVSAEQARADIFGGEKGYDFFFFKDKLMIPVGYSEAVTLIRSTKKISAYPSAYPRGHSIIVADQQQVIPVVISMPFGSALTLPERYIHYVDKQQPQYNQLIRLPLETAVSPQIISCRLNNRSFFSVANQLVEIDAAGQQHVHLFPHRILSLLPDSRGGLWVGVLGYGLYYIEDGDFSKPPVHSLAGLSVSNLMEDREQHIWCTTLEKGVYRCQQPEIIAFNDFYGLHRRMDFLGAENGSFIVSSRYNEFISIDQYHRPVRTTLTGNSAEAITAVTYIDQQWFIWYKERLCSGFKKGASIHVTKRTEFWDLQGLQHQEWGGLHYGLGYRTIYVYKNGKIRPIITRLPAVPRCFLPLDEDRFLWADNNGLQLAEMKSGLFRTRMVKGTLKSIVKLVYAKKSKRYFILTKGSGLFEWKNDRLVSCNKELQMPTDVLNDMVEDPDGNLWIATNEGLLKCPFNGRGYGKPALYDEKHGFPSNVYDKLAINGNTIAVSTTEGLITFPLHCILEPKTPPQLLLQSTVISGAAKQLQHAVLHHKENSITLNFSVLSHHQSSGQSLYYTLDCDGIVQKGFSRPDLLLQNLAPGNYRLRVFGQNVFGIKSLQPLTYTFTILPPFWTTWWFIVLAFVVGIVGVMLLVLWIKRRTEYRAEQSNQVKMKLARSQLSALQAQMNPHFLFNSISSIQNFIMSNKREEAYDYLTSFSRLIRNTLNNSRSQFISLAREIETLELYMQLEQRRYNYKFDFRLELSNAIDPETIFLPASLIQPLLENAVWHGVMTIDTEKRGLITLKIAPEGDFLRITVMDNGGGIQASDSTHQSLAITLIEEQLALLSGSNDKNSSTRIELMPGENGQGTTATFIIPLLNNV